MKLQGQTKTSHVVVEIDDNIILPNWIKERIERIYNKLLCNGPSSKENINNFCRCVLGSINPFVNKKITFFTHYEMGVLHILFSEETQHTERGIDNE